MSSKEEREIAVIRVAITRNINVDLCIQISHTRAARAPRARDQLEFACILSYCHVVDMSTDKRVNCLLLLQRVKEELCNESSKQPELYTCEDVNREDLFLNRDYSRVNLKTYLILLICQKKLK